MPPRQTIWQIEPHTKAKHQILLKCWQAWLPIMSSWNGRVLYIDGFAGPGLYLDGEPGSPIIALDAALNHSADIKTDIVFLFIEADELRAQHLEGLLEEKSLPANFRYHVYNSKFDDVITEVLDYLVDQEKRLAPAFVFVDPFGYSQTPFTVIQRLMNNPRCEVLITFMYQFINRFVSEENQWDHLDLLYGTDEWRNVFDMRTPQERRELLHGVYRRQLEEHGGAKYVLPFEMEDPKGGTQYFLFFCTNSLDGLAKMKRAMWTVDPSGNFRYSYAANPNQLRLLEQGPDFLQLRSEMCHEFQGQTVKVDQVEEFVLTSTPYLDSHYKRQVLVPLEREGLITVRQSPRKRRFTYPPGTIIKFGN